MDTCLECGITIRKGSPSTCALCVLKQSARAEYEKDQRYRHPRCYVCEDALPPGAYGERPTSALCTVCQVLNTRDYLAIMAFELTRVKLKRNL